jgi:23S rRNA pseudouridine2605 synthase
MLERLQKIIAHAGIASRRHAEQLILSGQVVVNGKVVRELGSKADASLDKIEAAGRLVEEAERKPVYLILHKPPEVVSTLADPEGRKTLRNFLRGFAERVYPVGNLEYAASGLILMTNDGTLTDKIMKSWSNIPQLYHIKVKGRLNLDELESLGGRTGSVIRVIRQPDSTRGHAQNFWYEAQVTGSKLDLLASTLLKSQHPLEKVKRVGLGPLSLEGLPIGRYAHLSKEQMEALQNPTRPIKFIPHPKSKPAARLVDHRTPSGRSERSARHPSVPGKAQHFSNPPFSKSEIRPGRYTKFQRRPSRPPNAPEVFEEFDDEHLDPIEKPRAPWLATSRPAANPGAAGRNERKLDRGSKASRSKGHRSWFHKPNRPQDTSSKRPRLSSARPKTNRSFPSRKPRPPR